MGSPGESRLCPGCWAGRPSAPAQPGWPAALSGRGSSWGGSLRPGRMEGGPSTPHAPVWVPLSLPWTPPRPPRPLLELLMPSLGCQAPWACPVIPAIKGSGQRAKVQPEVPRPSQYWWGWAVPSGSQEGLGRSRAALWLPRGLFHTLYSQWGQAHQSRVPHSAPNPSPWQAPPESCGPLPCTTARPSWALGLLGWGITVNLVPHALHLGVQTLLVLGGLGSQPRPGLEPVDSGL